MKNVIYQIVNVVTSIRYIGSAKSFKNRKRQHLRQLRKNNHYNTHLQSSWIKHGKEAFIFETVDVVPYAIELTWREQYWIDKYDFDTELYNISPTAGSTLGFRHSKNLVRKCQKNGWEKTILIGASLARIIPTMVKQDRKKQETK